MAVVRPDWPGPIPVIPPVPNTRIDFDQAELDGPPPTIEVDAGTYPQVVQLRVSAASVTNIDASPSQPLWAFSLEVFDAAGKVVKSPPQRPLTLIIPVAAFAAAGADPQYLSLAMVNGDGLKPVVSSYLRTDGTLIARLVSAGTIVVLRDPS